MAISQELVARLYIGYFNRAPDPEGLAYWVSRLEAGVSLEDISKSFANSPEAEEAYDYFKELEGADDLKIQTFLKEFYLNVFGREIDPDGLAYYTTQILDGSREPGQIATSILANAATNDGTLDQVYLANKVVVGLDFVAEANAKEGFNYNESKAAQAFVKELIAGVSYQLKSVDEGYIKTDLFFADDEPVPNPGGGGNSGGGGSGPDNPVPGVTVTVPHDLSISDDGTTLTGKVQPGNTVTATDANGNSLGDATAIEDGSFTITLDPPLTNGELVSLIAKNNTGNVSSPANVAATDSTPPAAPEGAISDNGALITGTAEPNSTVIATDDQNNQFAIAVVDADGHFSIPLNPPLINGEIVNLRAQDAAQNSSQEVTVPAPTLSPLSAADDIATLTPNISHLEESFSDTSLGSATWTTAILGTTSGSGMGTFAAEAGTALKDLVLTFQVSSLLTLNGLTVNWNISSEGSIIRAGSFGGGALLGGQLQIEMSGFELNAGEYTLSYTGSMPALALGTVTLTPSLTGTSVQLDEFLINAPSVEGNIFDGSVSENGSPDQLDKDHTKLSIEGADGIVKTLETLDDPGADATETQLVTGHYGTLSLGSNGGYVYTLNEDVALNEVTQKETFNYTLQHEDGRTAKASLTIDLALEINGTHHADTATSSPYNDVFALGGGADTVIFKLLHAGDATGGNGVDTWTDFSLQQGDKIALTPLLGWDGSSGTVSQWIVVEQNGNDTVISIDRDGEGTAFLPTELLVLQGVQTTLAELLEANVFI